MKNKENNVIKFFRPAGGKVIFAFVLLLVYAVSGFFCAPLFVDNFDSSDPGGLRANCGLLLGYVTTMPIFLAFIYPILWFPYLILAYLIACLVARLYNKLKKRN